MSSFSSSVESSSRSEGRYFSRANAGRYSDSDSRSNRADRVSVVEGDEEGDAGEDEVVGPGEEASVPIVTEGALTLSHTQPIDQRGTKQQNTRTHAHLLFKPRNLRSRPRCNHSGLDLTSHTGGKKKHHEATHTHTITRAIGQSFASSDPEQL